MSNMEDKIVGADSISAREETARGHMECPPTDPNEPDCDTVGAGVPARPKASLLREVAFAKQMTEGVNEQKLPQSRRFAARQLPHGGSLFLST